MVGLIVLEGPRQGERIPLLKPRSRVGRNAEADICLSSDQVSRNHAAIHCEGDAIYVEDLGSRNGTFLNGTRIEKRERLNATDHLTIGDFVLRLSLTPTAPPSTKGDAENDPPIREQVQANLTNQGLFTHNPIQKLQIVLEITQALSATTEVVPLLENLLSRLLQLFPRADRGLILMCENNKLAVRAQQARRGGASVDFPYSRTIVAKSLNEGVGILSDDVGKDERFRANQSIQDSSTRSLMCVPLITKNGRRLGVMQLEQTASVLPFQIEDLRLFTTISLQVTVVLDNVVAQTERLQHEMLRKELSVARDVQMGYLPTDFEPRPGYQIFAGIQPARDVSGDLYDFFPLPNGRLAFLVGDVSGKGMPAAMFMIAVRTLSRHLAPASGGPAETLARLNEALAADNPSMMFVTLSYGIFDPATGEVIIASGGHPPPLLISCYGSVDEIAVPPGRVLGYVLGDFKLTSVRLTLQPGDTLVLYSDGISEAFAPDGEAMFGVEGLQLALRGGATRTLAECAAMVNEAVQRFSSGGYDLAGERTLIVQPSTQAHDRPSAGGEIQDDQTLFLLRRL